MGNVGIINDTKSKPCRDIYWFYIGRSVPLKTNYFAPILTSIQMFKCMRWSFDTSCNTTCWASIILNVQNLQNRGLHFCREEKLKVLIGAHKSCLISCYQHIKHTPLLQDVSHLH